MRKISFDIFSSKSMDAAIRNLMKEGEKLESALKSQITGVLNEAKANMLKYLELEGISSDSELAQSIEVTYDDKSAIGKVEVTAPYAIYVEFGTGVVGQGSPHPAPDNWAYDVNGHGDSGWIYYDTKTSTFRWTKGQRSKPFFYQAVEDVKRKYGLE